ncbi:MAG: tryptophan synthase subunit alpha [Bacteroidales bacterium]
MSCLESTFTALRARHVRGLIAFVMASDPDAVRSADVIGAVDRAGADVIEIGVPYSDPVADGPVIQRASERARRAGGTLSGALDLVASIRPHLRAPVVLFTYANPAFRMGIEAFAARVAGAGIDGVLVVDLPVEESLDLRTALTKRGVDAICLVSPTTSDARLSAALGEASGFVYAISRAGVTGTGAPDWDGVRPLVHRVRRETPLPVAVGFGISRPEHVSTAVQDADAAVVGSGLVAIVEQAADEPDLVARVEAHVRWLRSGLTMRAS